MTGARNHGARRVAAETSANTPQKKSARTPKRRIFPRGGIYQRGRRSRRRNSAADRRARSSIGARSRGRAPDRAGSAARATRCRHDSRDRMPRCGGASSTARGPALKLRDAARVRACESPRLPEHQFALARGNAFSNLIGVGGSDQWIRFLRQCACLACLHTKHLTGRKNRRRVSVSEVARGWGGGESSRGACARMGPNPRAGMRCARRAARLR